MSTKSRNSLVINEDGYARVEEGAIYNEEWSISKYMSEQVTSQGNPFRLLGKVDWAIGGPFLSRKEYYSFPETEKYSRPWKSDSDFTAQYKGKILPVLMHEIIPPALPPVIPGSLDADGTHAIALTLPTNPGANLATSYGELVIDGIPKIIGSGLLKAKAKHFKDLEKEVGSEYLNVQFGWVPFVSDIRKAAKSVNKSYEIIRRFRDQSDTDIRAAYAFPVKESLETVDLGWNPLHYAGGSVGGESPFWVAPNYSYGHLTQTTRKREFKWFEGCYTYHLPLGDSWVERFQRYNAEANKLLGTRLTPEVLWNITPWSWFADWFGNVGDVIHNMSAFSQDGLVMKYGYMMEHLLYERTYTSDGANRFDGKSHFSVTAVSEQKRREPATPYGFGLSWDGFTPYQLSILAALGFTRGRSPQH
jgi:hypothetical protein